MGYPPDEDKRWLYDGAAYAMAWGPRETAEQAAERKAKTRADRKARKAAKAARRADRVWWLMCYLANTTTDQQERPS